MKPQMQVLLMAVVVAAVVGSLVTLALTQQQKSQDQLIKEFYDIENAVHVSPHSIRKHMGPSQDFALVDLRSQEEYEREHIIGAVSIPAYKDPETSAYGDVERIVNSFKALQESNPGKDIIVYCYSIPCMTGRKIGGMLAENGVYVQHLGIGWNEWRYFWQLWNHEHEWNQTDVMEYIYSGPEPGIPKGSNATSKFCPIDNEFGC
ncbi:MAG: rhodanese-like domain-containing protein [DPANN group archaeon]|nr:rhodanese-like domain-containing protein [DPANN group archaeon]